MGKGTQATGPRGKGHECCQAYWDAGDKSEHPQHVPGCPPTSDRYEAGDWRIVPILLVETTRHKRGLLTKEFNSHIMKKDA